MTTQQPIIYFDLDNTLIDTNKLVITIASGLEKKGVSKAIFEAVTTEYYQQMVDKTDFNQQQLIRLLVERTGKDSSEIEAVFFNPEYFEAALFPEVLLVLEKLSQMFELGTYTQGNFLWQIAKLKHSKLERFFQPAHLIIEQRKLRVEAIRKLQQGSIVIDDKLEVVTTLVEQRPDLQLHWLNRSKLEVRQQLAFSISEIHQLNDLQRLI